MKKNIQNLQNAVITNISNIPKRKYNKKINVELKEVIPETITSPENNSPTGVYENDNIQTIREANLIKAREARQDKLNNKQSDKERKINELVETINKEQIEKIMIKSDKLKSKLLKLI
jgi:hypothetical protein